MDENLTPPQLAEIEIARLEASVTMRRQREAIAGDESSIAFIQNVNAQIIELRKQL